MKRNNKSPSHTREVLTSIRVNIHGLVIIVHYCSHLNTTIANTASTDSRPADAEDKSNVDTDDVDVASLTMMIPTLTCFTMVQL